MDNSAFTPVAFDRARIEADLRQRHEWAKLVPGVLHFLAVYSDPDVKEKGQVKILNVPVGDVAASIDFVMSFEDKAHWNVYISLNVFRRDLPRTKRPSAIDCISVIGLVADCDTDLNRNRPIPVAATFEINSSPDNYQRAFIFDPPVPPGGVAPAAEALRNAANADKGTIDLDHVWRIDGTLNWPNYAKVHERGRAREPFPVRITAADYGRTYVMDALHLALLRAAPNGAPGAIPSSTPGTAPDAEALFHSLPQFAQDAMRSAEEYPSRSEATFAALCAMVKKGWSNRQIESVVLLHPNGPFERNITKGRLDKDFVKEIDRAREKVAQEKAAREKTSQAKPITDAEQQAIDQLATGNIDPFVALAKVDISFPFCDAALDALVKLMQEEPRVWQQLRATLKAAKVQIGALCGLIDAHRKANREPGNGGGKAIVFEEIEPWPTPVDGAELLSGISTALRRYMVMSPAHSDATALWTIHTWSHDFRDASPPLIVTSPVPGCAKTRLLDTVSRAVLRPLTASGITSASFVNVIDKHLPTLLIDEYDALMKGEREKAEAIRGAANAAHKRSGAFLIKNVATADGWEPRAFSVWAPIAIAGIDKPQRTLIERGIIIVLQKKLPDEKIERLRMKDGNDLRELARKVARWVADNERQLREIEPKMPSLSDRDCDKWDPLIAIADVAGGEWPERARKVAADLTKADAEDVLSQDVKQLLLIDIRDIFASLYPKSSKLFPDGNPVYEIGRGPRISTGRLLKELHGIAERDWGAFGRERKPLTDAGLSRMLNGYEVRPNNVRVNDVGVLSVPAPDLLGVVSDEALKKANNIVRKGYYLTSFAEAFSRYLGK
jgi:putative DNA primase/helicase